MLHRIDTVPGVYPHSVATRKAIFISRTTVANWEPQGTTQEGRKDKETIRWNFNLHHRNIFRPFTTQPINDRVREVIRQYR